MGATERDITCLYVGADGEDGGLLHELRGDGYRVTWMRSGLDVERELIGRRHDFLIMPLKLPDGDGIALLGRLRRSGDNTPAIVLSGQVSVGERVRALDAGADDVVSLPLPPGELPARIKALLRRCLPGSPPAAEATPLQEAHVDALVDRLQERLNGSGAEIRRAGDGYFIRKVGPRTVRDSCP